MATFQVTIEKIKVEAHPNADSLELAVIGDYRSCIQKDQFKTGDLVAYIPEAAILPEWLIEKLGLTGRLAGKAKNRVKAIKLRGVVSEGICLPVIKVVPEKAISNAIEFWNEERNCMSHYVVTEGEDVTELLGITKYVPQIPTSMNGAVKPEFGRTVKYDIENIKRYPDVLEEDEFVVITEKLHGTWSCFGYHPEVGYIVTSKGLSDKGLVFILDESNANNLYVKTFQDYRSAVDVLCTKFPNQPVYILGEIYGPGVQDLHYGQEKPTFRAFDVYVGEPGFGRYLDCEEMDRLCVVELGIATVPCLYVGAYSPGVVKYLTDGKETVSADEANIREGIVIKPATERRDNLIGRVILKSVSEDYLFRKGNVTEYQ